MSHGKEFDIVVFGASGFTGRLVAEYLATHHEKGQPVAWAMAGRNGDKLAAVRDEMGISADIPIIVADTQDAASMAALAARTACVLTTVGPYALYGAPLVEACVNAGIGYVDLTGEPLWMHEMIAKYEAAAQQSGARIVFSCGFDSIPFDLGVFALQQAAQSELGHAVTRVKCRVRAMNGEFSGGTAASLNTTMAMLGKNPSLIEVLTNPFCLTAKKIGPAQPDGNSVAFDADRDEWLAPFIMAPINTKNVHRSNALLGYAYGEDFVYDEMMIAGKGDEGKAIAEFVAGHNPLQGDNVPKPGEGPSRESREAGNYDVLFIGTDGTSEIHYAVSGDMDPGYGSTSKMIAQAALCLVRDCADLAGGIYTPAPAMGEKLIARLTQHAGLSFRHE